MSPTASTDYLNPETANAFFKTLFDDYEGGGFVEFRLFRNKRPTQKFIPIQDAIAHFPEILTKLRVYNDQDTDIYFGVLPRDREEGVAEAVSRCRVLWADVDRKTTPDLVDRFNKLIDMGIPPSYVIESGGGVHGYWILRDTHKPADCVPALKAIQAHLGGDSIFDAPRILRLPGTFNQKIKGTPRPCYVFKDTGRTYSLEDFELAINTAPPPPAPRPGAAPPNKEKGNANGRSYILAQTLAPFWKEGIRHQLAIGTAGMFRQAEFDKEQAEHVIKAIAAAAHDPEVEDRLKAVETTYATARDVAGASLLEQVLGNDGARYTRLVRDAIRRTPPKPVKRRKFPDFEAGACAPILDGFFNKYVANAFNATDAPLQYAIASAATVAAAALGNRVWTTYPRRVSRVKLFPTLYTMLAAKTSRYRKSTSVSIARNITRGAGLTVFSNNATPEQLFVRMAPEVAEVEEITDRKGNVKEVPVAWRGSPAGIIFHPEFSAILATVRKSYMSDLFSLYTDLYDGSADGLTSSRETKSSGRYFITDPAVSMLVAVTPSGLREHLEKTSMADGFMTRFLYVLAPPDHQTRDPWDHDDVTPNEEESFKEYEALIQDLNFLGQLGGEMVPTLEAAQIHQTFNREIDQRIRDYEEDGIENMDALVARLPSMGVKLSMIYSCAMGGFPSIIPEATALAVNFMRYVADTAEAFYATMRPEDRNRDANYVRSLLDLLRRMGPAAKQGISRRALMQRAHLDARQLDRAVDTLIEEGRVLKRTNSATGGTIYSLNEIDI